MHCDGSRLALVQGPRKGFVFEQSASIWNLALGKMSRAFAKKEHSVNCVALCGSIMATSSGSKTRCSIQLWHASTGAMLSNITNPGQVSFLLMTEPDDDP